MPARAEIKDPVPVLSGPSRKRFRELYLQEIRPFLEGGTNASLSDPEQACGKFIAWRREFPIQSAIALEELEQACEFRRQMDRQRQLHGWLHGWLLIHVPLSMALLVILGLHIVTALRVIPF